MLAFEIIVPFVSVSFCPFPSNEQPVEWNWQGKTEELGEKPVPVPLCPPQIPHGLSRDRTRASAVGGRRLIAWAMARPAFVSVLFNDVLICWDYMFLVLIPVSAQSKAWVFGVSLAGAVGSNTAEGMGSVSCECCVLSGRGLCVGLITHPEVSYWMCAVSECDRDASTMKRPWPKRECSTMEKRNMFWMIDYWSNEDEAGIIVTGITKYSEANLLQCYFVRHKSHKMRWAGDGPGPPRWEASDYPYELFTERYAP
jgi:hypothetical protein